MDSVTTYGLGGLCLCGVLTGGARDPQAGCPIHPPETNWRGRAEMAERKLWLIEQILYGRPDGIPWDARPASSSPASAGR